MRLWHLTIAVLFTSLVLAIARSEVGRVGLVVFVTALGEVALGTTALMQLFQTLGEFGAARTLVAHLEALVATVLVLVVASALMNGLLWVGMYLLCQVLGW